jgi:hypothetical protein
MPRVTTTKSADPEQQLQNFIGKFEPKPSAKDFDAGGV